MLQTKFYLLSVVLLLAACTQDELADGSNTLPEGKYPLEIVSVTMDVTHSQQPWNADAPQTRVSESENRNSSVWQNGDKIKVQIADGTPGTYTYQDGSLTVADGDVPAYWASKNDTQPIRSWYTSSGSETVSLENQTNSLAYVLTANTTANFNQSVSLAFAHALAKVRVVLTGEKKDGVTDVKINTFTSCTLHADGTLTAGDTKGYIPMERTTYNGETCWEANVVPVPENETTDYEITHVKINDKEIIPLSTPLAPLAAKVNTIELLVAKEIQEVTPSDKDQTINLEDGDVVKISGEGKGSFTFNVSEGNTATVNLNNVKLNSKVTKPDDTPNYAFKVDGGGTVVFKLKGTTTVEGYRAAIKSESGTSANIHIQGPGTLKVRGNNVYGGIVMDNGKEIRIENATIDMTDCQYSSGSYPGAAIGAGSGSTCGDITIENCDINIGIVLDWISGGEWYGAAIGSGSSDGICGNINITLKEGQSKGDFLNKISVTNKNSEANPNKLADDKKVGKGLHGLKSGTVTWRNSDGSPAN